jgi:hypothetical protein
MMEELIVFGRHRTYEEVLGWLSKHAAASLEGLSYVQRKMAHQMAEEAAALKGALRL